MSKQTKHRDQQAESLIVRGTLLALACGIADLVGGEPHLAFIGFGGAVLGSVLYPLAHRKV